MHHSVHENKKVIVMDSSRPELEGALKKCLPGNKGFCVVQLNTVAAGCRAVANANGSVGKMVVAIGDMPGINEDAKAALRHKLVSQLGVNPAKVIPFNVMTSAEHLAGLVELCAE